MSHISFVRVTITPRYYQDQSMLEIKTIYRGEDLTCQIPFESDSFETEFEHIMKEAQYQIEQLVKEKK